MCHGRRLLGIAPERELVGEAIFSYSPKCVEEEFCEVELPIYRILGSCTRICNRSYLSTLYNWAGLPRVPPFGKRGQQVSKQTTNRAFDELARALAEGSISRRRALKLFAGTALAALIPSRA